MDTAHHANQSMTGALKGQPQTSTISHLVNVFFGYAQLRGRILAAPAAGTWGNSRELKGDVRTKMFREFVGDGNPGIILKHSVEFSLQTKEIQQYSTTSTTNVRNPFFPCLKVKGSQLFAPVHQITNLPKASARFHSGGWN